MIVSDGGEQNELDHQSPDQPDLSDSSNWDTNRDPKDAVTQEFSPAALEMDRRQQRDADFSKLAEMVNGLEQYSQAFRMVARLVRPSVVHIQAAKRSLAPEKTSHYRNLDNDLPVEEVGSGTIIRVDGKYYVLTNRHVIHDAQSSDIQIQLWDGRIVYPIQVRADHSTDVALLGIEEENLTPARLGDSSETSVGDLVLAFGSPFGLNHSVTLGIVSAMGRRDLHLGNEDLRIQDFLQTDAAINPGNSGGPLLNLRGEVIAVNTAIAGNSGGNDGIAFSIPINLARHVCKYLLQDGELPRPYMGVRLSGSFGGHDTQRLDEQRFCGAKVASVSENSPAFEAGLMAGDIILQYNQTYIEDDSHFANLVGLSSIGSESRLVICRDGRNVEIPIVIRERGQQSARVAERVTP